MTRSYLNARLLRVAVVTEIKQRSRAVGCQPLYRVGPLGLFVDSDPVDSQYL
jgi:hypothetical protein